MSRFLRPAVRANQLDEVETLLALGANPTPVLGECTSERMLRRLLAAAPAFEDNWTVRDPVYIYCIRRRYDLARILIEAGASADDLLLDLVEMANFTDIRDALVADIGLRVTDTTMHFALRHGTRCVLLLLLDHGGHVDATNAHGHTLLHEALSWRMNLGWVEMLLYHGADATVSGAFDALCDYPFSSQLARLVRQFKDQGAPCPSRRTLGQKPVADVVFDQRLQAQCARVIRRERGTRWPPVAAKDDPCTPMTLVALCARCIRRERLPLGEVAAVSFDTSELPPLLQREVDRFEL